MSHQALQRDLPNLMLAQVLTRQLHDDLPTELLSLLTRLKYPHRIPANCFQSPNFEMMFDILCWLVKILDPTIPIEKNIVSESDRMNLLNGIVSELAARFDIYIDTKQFCSADDCAVNELIKVPRFIEKALQLAEEISTSPEEHFQVEDTIKATKRARSLVDEVTEICSRLSDLLEKESDDRKDRTNALRFLNSILGNNVSARDHCNLAISRKLDVTHSAIDRLDRQCKILISSQRGTEEKIQKKTIDLEQSSKRQESLKEVRPAYMDEYEKLEKDLEVEYGRYVVRLRNKDYLAGELSFFNQVATEMRSKSERSIRRMQKKFRDDELRVLNGCNESEVASMPNNSSEPIHPKDKGKEGSDVPGSYALSASVTPREIISRTKSDGTPSEPSGGEDESFESSETTRSLMLDNDGDSDSYF